MKQIIIVLLVTSSTIFSQIKFDADFESGNLNEVSTTDSVSWSVTTVSDIGGRWFYFRISGVEDKYIEVSIPSSDVNRPMYSYDNETFQRFTPEESPQVNYFEKTFPQDTVYIAYYTPYTFSHLQKKITDWKQSSYATVDTIGYTDHDLPMQKLTITDPFIPDSSKKSVWIHSRTHPGETPSSFHFEGIVNTLLSDKDVIDFYRRNVVYHLVPFTNPEGVYYGRSRTDFYGNDIESSWDLSQQETPTEVKLLKEKMSELSEDKEFDLFLNLHSIASPSCTFFIHTPASTSERFYREEYQFANLNTSDNPYFAQEDYSESYLDSRYPEGWLWDNYGANVMALTYETPYDQYSNGTWVSNENLFEIGERTVYAIAEFLEFSHPKHLLLDNRDALTVGDWNIDSAGLDFYSDNYYTIPGDEQGNYIEFSTPTLQSGAYDIYGWWPQDNSFAYNAKYIFNAGGDEIRLHKTQKSNGGQWNFLSEVELQKDGIISITMNDSAAGLVAADAFRVLYRGEISGMDQELPHKFVLNQNYPNPFNPATTIQFQLQTPSYVELKVYNTLGQLVTTLLNRKMSSGNHQVIFNSRDHGNLSSGVYYYQLKAGDYSKTKGMVLLK